jgi:hypothetical protein
MGHQATFNHTVKAQVLFVLFSLLHVTHAFYEVYSYLRILPTYVISH